MSKNGSFLEQLQRVNAQIASAHLADDDPNKVHARYVTEARREWMRRPESEREWSPEALEFARKVLANEFKHPRGRRISPSSIGEGCARLVLFSYGGHPKTPFPLRNQDLMDQGSFLHLKWQMEGLTAGWAKEGEVWTHDPDFGPGVGGSIDLVLGDDSLGEVKTVGAGPFNRYAREPYPAHLLQMETYWEVDSRTEQRIEPIGSLVYVNRESGAFVEHRVRSQPNRRQAVRATIEDHGHWIDIDELPDMLEVCRSRSSDRYLGCQYHATCPTATAVHWTSQQAVEASG